MAGPIILAEKLRRPDQSGLPRPRLETPLLAGPSGGLALVVAPPGSGKTTLLARVAAQFAGPVAWYRVTADDSEEPALVGHLARALAGAIGTAIPGELRMDSLLEALDGWPGSGLVVLDDLHEIATSAAEHALEQFVALRPPALRILIGTRRQPGINTPRLRVSGLLREISSEDLRFRSWEVEELFVGVFGEPLPPEAAAALTRRTGGWAAGLQLFHLATAGRSAGQRAQAVADLGGRSKLIRSYLARNVLDELPADRRTFLIRTSTLGPMTGPLCDQLLGITGSGRILGELEHQQLFTSSADDGQTFRYHEVLRTHLELALIEEYGTDGARSWYSRSAKLLEEAGEQRAAIRAYARAEDWHAVTRLVRERHHGATDADLLLPDAIVDHDPWLALVEARRRLRDGALRSAVEAFRQAEKLLDEPDFRALCRSERETAAIWLRTNDHPSGIPRPRSAPGDPAAPSSWVSRLREATRRAPGDSAGGAARAGPAADGGSRAAAAGDRLAAALGSLFAGRLRDAEPALSAVASAAESPASQRLFARLGGAVAELATAGTDPSPSLGDIALDAETEGLPWVARLARGLNEAVLVAQGSPDWRIAACDDHLRECERAGDPWGAALVQLAAALAGHLIGDEGTAGKFADAAARFDALDAPVPAVWARALGGLHLAVRGQLDPSGNSVAAVAESLGVPGAQAVALAADAAGSGTRGAAVFADELAGRCGLRMALVGLIARAATSPPTSDSASGDHGGVQPKAFRSTDAGPTGQAVPPVRVTCFGGFGLQVAGAQVALDSLRPRARALLRLLALTPDVDVHREQLVETLWPGTALAAATRRLQVAVSSIRQLLEQYGPDLIVRHGDAYRLQLPTGSSVDVRDFEQLLRSVSLARRGDRNAAVLLRQRALALYTDDLLPEDGPAEHVAPHRERLRLAAAATAADLADDLRVLGDGDGALDAARLSVRLDPYQDRPWQLLVELHLDAGDATAAEQARRGHARAIADLEAADA